MPIERHALYFYAASASQQQTSDALSENATCTCRIHVPVTSVASASKNLGKSPMVTWKLAAPSIKSKAGQQYELAYPVTVDEPSSVKGGPPGLPWNDRRDTNAFPRAPSSSASSSPLNSPLSRSVSSDSVASLAHSEVSTISSYTSCSSLPDLDDSLPVQVGCIAKKLPSSPECERSASSKASLAPLAVEAMPRPALDSILVAQTVQRQTRAPLAPVSKGMPFIPDDACPKSPTLPLAQDLFEMNSRTSTLLRIDGFKAYIGLILEDFDIFPQARKDFIDYWYTRFRDQEYLAVRLLTAKEYAALLPLNVTSSSPYTLQRLFALFKRVTNDEAKHWYSSRLRVIHPRIDWKERVGQTVIEATPRSRTSSSRRSVKEGSRSEDMAGTKVLKASLLEIGAMEIALEAGIGRFFFV